MVRSFNNAKIMNNNEKP